MKAIGFHNWTSQASTGSKVNLIPNAVVQSLCNILRDLCESLPSVCTFTHLAVGVKVTLYTRGRDTHYSSKNKVYLF